MKKILFFITMMVLSIGLAQAQGKAEIKFDKTTHDFGTFSENNPVVSCTFKFTNIGDAPLVIHQAVASCGCTVPEYTQEPIMPLITLNLALMEKRAAVAQERFAFAGSEP